MFNIGETLWEPEDQPLMVMLSQEPQPQPPPTKPQPRTRATETWSYKGDEDRRSGNKRDIGRSS